VANNHDCLYPELIRSMRKHIDELPTREARLTRIEEAIKSVRGWAIIAAFIGGLLGRAAPDAVNTIVKTVYAEDQKKVAHDAMPSSLF